MVLPEGGIGAIAARAPIERRSAVSPDWRALHAQGPPWQAAAAALTAGRCPLPSDPGKAPGEVEGRLAHRVQGHGSSAAGLPRLSARRRLLLRWLPCLLGALVLLATLPPTRALAAASQPSSAPLIARGAKGKAVLELQRRLASLGYWLGRRDGVFGDTTEQAVLALQKAARIGTDGIVGPLTRAALARGVVPRPRPVVGHAIEIDLEHQLLLIVDGHRLDAVLNTSTGGGYWYRSGGALYRALTPAGRYRISRQVNGLDVSPLGELWRPKYFNGGIALHGYGSVPPLPVSHGCVRVSIAAMNWIWAANLAPIGTAVYVY